MKRISDHTSDNRNLRKSYDPRKKNKHYIDDDDDDDQSVVCMQNKTQFTLFLCLLQFYSKPNMYMMTVW